MPSISAAVSFIVCLSSTNRFKGLLVTLPNQAFCLLQLCLITLVHRFRTLQVPANNHILPSSFHSIPPMFHLSDVQTLVLEPRVTLLVDMIQSELIALAKVLRKNIVCNLN
jgi:hypothetical protein